MTFIINGVCLKELCNHNYLYDDINTSHNKYIDPTKDNQKYLSAITNVAPPTFQ